MGFAIASITKALMAKKALPKIVKAFACKSCNSIAAVKVYANRVEVVRCGCK